MDAPACLVPATIAHEMSHQRMVFSRAGGQFLGIAAAVSCGDPVFQYSGWLMGLIQLCNALYAVSPDLWYQIAAASFTPELSTDWEDNNAYWRALESPVEEAAAQTFDTFLKSNGQDLGIQSYGACVDLLGDLVRRRSRRLLSPDGRSVLPFCRGKKRLFPAIRLQIPPSRYNNMIRSTLMKFEVSHETTHFIHAPVRPAPASRLHPGPSASSQEEG